MKKIVLFLFAAVMMLAVRGIAQSTCNAPTGLTASLHAPEWNNVLLNWNAVEDSTQADLMWSTTTLYTRIGSTTGGDFIGTVRFTPTELASYAGRYLTSISFIPGTAEDIAPTTYTIMVWQGGSIVDDTVFNPGTLIVNQPITAQLTPSAMNTILLDTAQLIDVTQELWIGIHCVFDTTAYPLGASNNGGVAGNGLLLYDYDDEEWGDLTNSSSLSSYNWIIIGNLQESSNILSGYNLYRNDALIASVGATSYLDSVVNGDYTYGLTAQYASGCESAPISVSVSMNSNPCADCTDTVIVDGNGTSSTSYILPLNTFYNYSISEQIYTVAELGTIDGAINCISFQYIYSTPQSKNIVVYMGNTSKSSFSGGDWVPVSDMFQVFNGTINFTNAGTDNWVNIPFDIPFEYDGTSNIVVAVLNNTGSYVTSSNPTFNVHSASGKSLYLYNDSSPYNMNSLGSGTVGSERNNIRFLVGEPIVCPMPTHLTVTNVTDQGAVISWSSNDNHNGYELVLVPEGSTLNNETPVTLNDTFYVATELTSNTEYSVYVRGNCGADNSFWNMQTFKTLCAPTAQLPYVMDMDGFGSGSGHIPDCAEVGIGTGYTSYPYCSSTKYHSGNASLYFYSYTPNSSMIRFQGLDLTENTQPLVMRFFEQPTSSGYGYVQAGYMTDPTDFSTFVLVKTVYSNEVSTNTWTEIVFPLPDMANGQVIYPVLYCPFAPGSSSNYLYIDDLVIEVGQTTCMAPHNMQFNNVGGSSAQVSWTPDATASGSETYHVEYSEAGTDNWQSVTTTSTFCLIGGLSQQTLYDVRLFMDCDENGYSDTLTGTLLTKCLAGGELAIGNGTSTNSYLPSYSFYNYSYTQQIYLASEMNGPSTLTSIAFNASAITSQRTYKIYLMHTTATSADNWLPTDSAVMVYSGSPQLVVGWNTFNFTAPFAYNGNDNIAVIVIDETGSYASGNQWMSHTASGTLSKYIYQDSDPYSINTTPSSGSSGTPTARNNVKFGGDCDSVATCIAPNVVVTGYSDEEITIAWVAGDQETSWEVEYKTADTTEWTNVGTVTATTYTFTGLASSTDYNIRLRSVCGSSDFSSWTNVNAFTVCEYIEVPYTQDFESATGSGSSYFIDCWFRGTNNSTQYPYASTSYATSGTHSLYFYGTSAYYCYAATPRFDDSVEMDSLAVNFNLYATSSGYSIEMGVMTDPSDYSTFVPVNSFTVPMAGIWGNYETTTQNYLGNGRYLAFRIPQWGSSYVYLDDLSVEYLNPCEHPTNISLLAVGTDYATINWSSNADEWEYVYGPAGTVDLDDAVTETTYLDMVTLNNLQPNTTYDFYVRAVCTGVGESFWRSITFTTECLPLNELPYTQNFDSMCTHTSNTTSGLNNLSDCWHAHNNGTSYSTYPYVYYSSSYAASGSYSLRFYTYTSTAYDDQYAILPAIDTDTYPINSLQLTFDASRYSTSYPFCLVIGAMTGTDINTFQPIDTMLINSGGTNYETQLIFFSNFTGTGDRLAIMAPKSIGNYVPGAYYNEGQIDNLVLAVASECPQPTHLEVDNVTETSVTLSWNENGSATSWEIAYGAPGFDPDGAAANIVTANTNPFTMPNLTPATSYEFYVRAVCSASEQSLWVSQPAAATTLCSGTVALPYTETFEGYTGTTYSDANGIAPVCWTTYSTNTSYGAPHIVGSGSYHYSSSGNSMIFTCSSAGTDAYAALPEFDQPLNTLHLNFWRAMESTSSGVLKVGYATNLTNLAGSFVEVATIPSVGSSNGDTISVDFTAANIPATGYICFHWYKDGTYYSCCIDNVNVTASGSGPVITDPTVATTAATAVAQTTATLNGTITNPDNVTITAKGFQWKATTGGTYQTVNATGSGLSYNLTGLTPSTGYTFRAFITFNGQTVYGNEMTFTTLEQGVEPCDVPTGLHTTNIENHAITIAWDANASVESWNIQYRVGTGTWSSATSTTNSYTITNLQGNTDYEIQVQANCGNGNLSDWSSSVTAHTTNVGIENFTENNVILFPNPAREYVDIRIDGDVNVTNMEVFDVYGKLINTVNVIDNPTRINVSSLANGMYFVRVTTEAGAVTKTFVKK